VAIIEFCDEETIGAPDHVSYREVAVSRYPEQTYSLAAGFNRPKYFYWAPESSALTTRPRWLAPVMNRLNELARLPGGWDERSGLPVAVPTAVRALNLLGLIADATAPSPWVVPLGSGGVQLEWHEGNTTIEVALDGEGGDEVYIRDGGSETEGALGDSALGLLSASIARLTR
jgi:hypothetical protein